MSAGPIGLAGGTASLPQRMDAAWRRLPAGVRWACWVGVALLVLVARRPETLLRPQFVPEDAQVFYLGTYVGDPLEGILRPYAGYLHLVPRLVALAERLVPVATAPLVANLAALLIAATVAAYVASDRLAEAVPSRAVRWTLGGLIVVLPNSHEALGSITYAQWYLGIYLLAAAFAGLPRSRAGEALDLATLGVAALSGPQAMLLTPLHVVRAIRERDRETRRALARRALAVTVPAGLQLAVFLSASGARAAGAGVGAAAGAAGAAGAVGAAAAAAGAAGAVGAAAAAAAAAGAAGAGGPSLDQLLTAAALRFVDAPFLGAVWTSLLASTSVAVPAMVVVTGIVAALLLATLAGLPRRAAAALLYAVVVLDLATLARTAGSIGDLLDPGVAERYVLIPTAILGAAAILVATGPRGVPRRAAAALLAILVLGIVGDARLPPQPDLHWPEASACIGGPAPCAVPLHPAGWYLRWPGAHGTYDQVPVPGPP